MANTFITRAQWGARSPQAAVNTTSWSSRDQFITHYSAGPPTQTVRQIQDFHMNSNGWADIGYNFLVDIHGNKYEGRLHTWMAIGAHAQNHNTRSIGVCMIGRDSDVTDAAKQAIRDIYDEACGRAGKSLRMLGHRDVNPTTCPGDNLWNWVHGGMEAMSDMDLNQVGGIIPGITNAQVFKDIWTWLCGIRGLVEYDAEGNPMRRADDRFAEETWQHILSQRINSLLAGTPVVLTPEQLEAIKEAARQGAAAGAQGASPEEVEAIVDEQLDQAFAGGADTNN
jgi:hypothetical protein